MFNSVQKSVKCRVSVRGRGPSALRTEWVRLGLRGIVMKVLKQSHTSAEFDKISSDFSPVNNAWSGAKGKLISQLVYRVFLCFYSIILYPLFYNVTSFSLRVIICKTLKKKCSAFRNIGFKYTQFLTVKSALLLFRFHILSLIRFFTIGSGRMGSWIRYFFFVTVVFTNIELVFIILYRPLYGDGNKLPVSI